MDHKSEREKKIRETKKNIILDAAIDAFSKKGFYETRLEDIADEAGFSKASLYNYYKDKETIFINLSIRELSRVIEKTKNIIDNKNSAITNIELIVKTFLSFLGEHFAFTVTLNNAQAGSCFHNIKFNDSEFSKLKKKFEKLNSDLSNLIEHVLKDGIKNKEFNSNLDISVIRKFIATLIRGTMFNWKLENKMGNIQENTQDILEFVKYGIKYKK